MYFILIFDGNKSAMICVILNRRYREFINLRARLQKANQFSKSLKSIKTPRWWQQLSLTTLKPSEVEKRRQQLEIFLMQVNAHFFFNRLEYSNCDDSY